jgi:hypothetical protein
MIKGNIGKPGEIKVEDILEKVDDYNIIRFYLGEDFDFKKKFRSPFRANGIDKTPNLCFFPSDERIIYKDFATGNSGDCFKFVQEIFGLTFYQALLKIDKDLGLGLKDKSRSPVFKIQVQKRPQHLQKSDTLIQIVPRDFTDEDMYFWDNFHITKEELERKKVHSVDKLYVNKQLIQNRDNSPRFAYEYDGYLKIYTPFSKTLKWISSCPNDYISGFDEIKFKIFSGKQSDKLIITKSLKDEIILSKFLPDVCSTQNESEKAINEENIQWIMRGYKRENVYIAYDADKAGQDATMLLTYKYGFNSLYIPTYIVHLGIKDWADIVKRTSLKKVESLLRIQGLIML